MKVWLCIEQDSAGPRITNLPGGLNHCYFTGQYAKGKPKHLPDCGWKVLVDPDSWRLRSDFAVMPMGETP